MNSIIDILLRIKIMLINVSINRNLSILPINNIIVQKLHIMTIKHRWRFVKRKKINPQFDFVFISQKTFFHYI